jgi:hypothetical protein
MAILNDLVWTVITARGSGKEAVKATAYVGTQEEISNGQCSLTAVMKRFPLMAFITAALDEMTL